jgi:hypothetical protein
MENIQSNIDTQIRSMRGIVMKKLEAMHSDIKQLLSSNSSITPVKPKNTVPEKALSTATSVLSAFADRSVRF